MPPRKSLHMQLIHDHVVETNPLACTFPGPVEIRIDHRAFRHERRAIPFIKGEIIGRFHLVAEQRGIPLQFSDVRAGIRV